MPCEQPTQQPPPINRTFGTAKQKRAGLEAMSERNDFEIFQSMALGWNHSSRGYLPSNLDLTTVQITSDIPSPPELLALQSRFYYRSYSSVEPVYGSSQPFERRNVEKIDFLSKPSERLSSNLNLKSLPVINPRKMSSALRKQHTDLYLPPEFPSYCEYLRGNSPHS
jgi:hypothetical protein